ncbi:MAG: hypothetical protein KAZ87_06200 [Spirochaetes bacterium]|nr:hypothetical protein [Spirochaetota bacterium]
MKATTIKIIINNRIFRKIINLHIIPLLAFITTVIFWKDLGLISGLVLIIFPTASLLIYELISLPEILKGNGVNNDRILGQIIILAITLVILIMILLSVLLIKVFNFF